jgi:hypothetical protein
MLREIENQEVIRDNLCHPRTSAIAKLEVCATRVGVSSRKEEEYKEKGVLAERFIETATERTRRTGQNPCAPNGKERRERALRNESLRREGHTDILTRCPPQ